MKNSVLKLLYFQSHPVQYFSPLLKQMASDVDLEVYYFSDISVTGGFDAGFSQKIKWDIPLLDGYRYQFLKNYSRRKTMDNNFLDAINPSVLQILSRTSAKVMIINGWTYSSYWMVMLAARLKGRKVWVRGDNPLYLDQKGGKMKLWLKKLYLKYFVLNFFVDKCLYVGVENKKYFAHYGMQEKDLIFTPHAVDNRYFQSKAEELKTSRDSLRLALNIPPHITNVILFVGKYIEQKRPLDLVKAFEKLNDPNSILLMVGEGKLRGELENYIREKELQHVVLTGFVNQSEIVKYYAVADIFVLCSGSETWGLAVNEAMNFGLPILVSNSCGCSADLIHEGVNGYVFEEGNTNQLANYLRRFAKDNVFRNKAGEESINIIKDYSFDRIIASIKKELVDQY